MQALSLTIAVTLAAAVSFIGCSSSSTQQSGPADAAAEACESSPCFGGGDANVDLDAGDAPPSGKQYCTPDPNDQFGCFIPGEECCAAKELCFDPSKEPTFCS